MTDEEAKMLLKEILNNIKGSKSVFIIDLITKAINAFETVEALEEALEKVQSCCPYDNTTCKKTNCFINGGWCYLRSKKMEEE